MKLKDMSEDQLTAGLAGLFLAGAAYGAVFRIVEWGEAAKESVTEGDTKPMSGGILGFLANVTPQGRLISGDVPGAIATTIIPGGPYIRFVEWLTGRDFI